MLHRPIHLQALTEGPTRGDRIALIARHRTQTAEKPRNEAARGRHFVEEQRLIAKRAGTGAKRRRGGIPSAALEAPETEETLQLFLQIPLFAKERQALLSKSSGAGIFALQGEQSR